MADITMCSGKDCPLKEKCYRFKATANEFRQSYFCEIPFDVEDESCKYFSEEEEIEK